MLRDLLYSSTLLQLILESILHCIFQIMGTWGSVIIGIVVQVVFRFTVTTDTVTVGALLSPISVIRIAASGENSTSNGDYHDDC